jgi:hypothetical protein
MVTTKNNKDLMLDTRINRNPIRVQLQTNALEEGSIGRGWIMVTATHTHKIKTG